MEQCIGVVKREELLNSPISKAVILARGLGTRMRRVDPDATLSEDQISAAESGVKGMIPIGRPFMDYLLSALADAGFTYACLVTGPEHDATRSYYDQVRPGRIRVSYAIQTEARGTADAVNAAEVFVGGDGFLVINSDNYYPLAALRAARLLPGPGLVAFSSHAMISHGGVPLERVAAFPRVEVGNDGYLARLCPSFGPATAGHVSMNCWRFGPAIFEACRSIGPSPRGELELPDAVEYSMRQLGQRYRVEYSDDPVLDLSSRSDIARVTRQLQGIDVHL